MRSRFDEQLALLNKELIEMGALCEEVISLVAKSLSEGDKKYAEKVAPLDHEIDQAERSIESICLKLLLQQQPVARDLRQISAALKMITDMERIGDQAEDIADIILSMGDYECEKINILQDMAAATMKMVTESAEAYVKSDIKLAEKVLKDDDIVDGCFDNMRNYLIESVEAGNGFGECAVDLLMIAKYFERIGDHATNIAEWVIFSITGEHKEA